MVYLVIIGWVGTKIEVHNGRSVAQSPSDLCGDVTRQLVSLKGEIVVGDKT